LNPPFTVEQFFDVFRHYNEVVWPAQAALVAIGAIAAFAALHANVRRSWRSVQVAIVSLAALWLWAGIVYHKTFFVVLTPAGEIFGSLFIAEAALLLISLWQGGPAFEPAPRPGLIIGLVLLAYALVGYPVLGYALGQRYPAVPSFGAPCPTTIFTFAIFCLLPASIPRFAMAIPVLWALIGSYAGIRFGVGEDLGRPVAAVAAMIVIHEVTHRATPRYTHV
jgi:hypothetical protein